MTWTIWLDHVCGMDISCGISILWMALNVRSKSDYMISSYTNSCCSTSTGLLLNNNEGRDPSLDIDLAEGSVALSRDVHMHTSL